MLNQSIGWLLGPKLIDQESMASSRWEWAFSSILVDNTTKSPNLLGVGGI